MTNKTLYIWLGIGGIFLVFVIFILARNSPNSEINKSEYSNTASSTEQTASSSPATASTTNQTAKIPVIKRPPVPTGQTASESYLQALKIYKNSGYYLQFYPCQATPGTLTVKKGSKIMLDNRDSKTHVIGIKSVKYNIGSYNFAIATLNTLGTNYITCDGGGSAQITVVP